MIRMMLLLAIGLGIIVGIITPAQGLRRIALMMVTPIVILAAQQMFLNFWAGLSVVQKVGLIAASPILALGALSFTSFGRYMLASAAGHALYDILVFFCRLPFRLLRFLFRTVRAR